ncbi:MAG: ATP synthase gamma chain [Candidatus Binatia bacterium]|nr:MAG: ATP synthase gamma chain [Candidatus Binatia bacterium]
MASLKALRKRVASVRNTQQITKAMKMVSAAKLRRAQDAATSARPYARKLEELLQTVASHAGARRHPLLVSREERVRHLILVTADRGLCGGYNANLVRKAEEFLRQHGSENVRLVTVGRRGHDFFKRRPVSIVAHHGNLPKGPDRSLAELLAKQLAEEYREGKTDAVYVLYAEFRSTLSQVPTVRRILPVGTPVAEGPPVEYLYEPGAAEVLARLLEQYVVVLIYRAFLEAVASEHAARMTAMDNATSNASEMIDRLTLQMNRARQAAITKELMEIVSGAEALKG